jgi:hypothetical protein
MRCNSLAISELSSVDQARFAVESFQTCRLDNVIALQPLGTPENASGAFGHIMPTL